MGDQRKLTRVYARTGMVRGKWGAENGPRRSGVESVVIGGSQGPVSRGSGACSQELTMSGQVFQGGVFSCKTSRRPEIWKRKKQSRRQTPSKETLLCRSGGQNRPKYRPPAAETRHRFGEPPGWEFLFRRDAIGGVPLSSFPLVVCLSAPAVLAYEGRGIIDRTSPLRELFCGLACSTHVQTVCWQGTCLENPSERIYAQVLQWSGLSDWIPWVLEKRGSEG